MPAVSILEGFFGILKASDSACSITKGKTPEIVPRQRSWSVDCTSVSGSKLVIESSTTNVRCLRCQGNIGQSRPIWSDWFTIFVSFRC